MALKRFLVPLWFSLLYLPFKGPVGAIALFAALAVLFETGRFFIPRLGKAKFPPVPEFNKKILIPPAALFLLAYPLIMRDYIVDITVLAGIYIVLAEGLNVVVGFTGLLNLGFAAFYAIGAYSCALLTTKAGLGFWTALPLSTGLSALAGFLLAVPALRLRGDYLAIVTLGFGEITYLVLNNWDGFTNGPNGISGIPRPTVAGFSLGKLDHFYYLTLLMVVLSVAVVRNVCASKIGRAWLAIREDETAASASGINTMAYKFYSFSFGAFFAGLGGALFAAKMQFVSPESFRFMESVLILCMVILGGLGSVAGSALGAVMLVMLPELLREAQLYRMLVLGAGLVILMIVRPQGLLGGKGASLRD